MIIMSTKTRDVALLPRAPGWSCRPSRDQEYLGIPNIKMLPGLVSTYKQDEAHEPECSHVC